MSSSLTHLRALDDQICDLGAHLSSLLTDFSSNVFRSLSI